MNKNFVCKIFILTIVCFSFSSPFVAALDIAYRISMPDPGNHRFSIEMTIAGIDRETLSVQMPAWSPGKYLILNFARNVSRFSAEADSQSLPVEKLDKQTWEIQTRNHPTITIRYQVFSHNLTGEHSFLDNAEAFLVGASLYMYVAGFKDNPVSLEIVPPVGWSILSSAGEAGQTRFSFPNYDLMIDELVQLGTFSLEQFSLGNVRYRVCVFTETNHHLIPQLVETVWRIQETAVQLFRPLDQTRYTYFFHFLPDSEDGTAMEHLNCCQLTRRHPLSDTGPGMDWTIWTVAHELTHAWNVKRLRPQYLGPFDYSKEVHSPYIWLAEGCTNYLADLIMLRSELWSREQFLNWLADEISTFRNSPGKFDRSPEMASFDFWLAPYDEFRQSDFYDNWLSPYISGETVGMCMDLLIRHQTGNQRDFLDFFNTLYDRQYDRAEPESYYLKGRGYTRADILQVLEEITSESWDDFYNDYIASPGDIPFEYYLDLAALELLQTNDTPSLTVQLNLIDPPREYPEDLHITSELVDAYRRSINAAPQSVSPVGETEDILERIERLSETTDVAQYKIVEKDDADPLAIQIREDWLSPLYQATQVNWQPYDKR